MSGGTGVGAASSASRNARIAARGSRVLALRLGVADTDPEQDPARKLLAERRDVLRDLRRFARPHVEDAGGGDEPLGRRKERPQRRHLRGAAKPHRAKVELLDQLRRRTGVLLADRAERRPDAEPAEIHGREDGMLDIDSVSGIVSAAMLADTAIEPDDGRLV